MIDIRAIYPLPPPPRPTLPHGNTSIPQTKDIITEISLQDIHYLNVEESTLTLKTNYSTGRNLMTERGFFHWLNG